MQVQKEEIRQRILDAALDEFFQYGYKGASVRRIAEKAGVTPGNIYTYFAGKNGLFTAILSSAKSVLVAFIQEHAKDSIQMLSKDLMDLFTSHYQAFYIMMEGSEGTEFANSRHELEEFTFKRLSQEKEFAVLSNDVRQAVAIAMISGMIYLFERNLQDNARLKDGLEGFLAYLLNEEER